MAEGFPTTDVDPTQFTGEIGTVTDVIKRWEEYRRTGTWVSQFEIVGDIPDPEVFAFDVNEDRAYGGEWGVMPSLEHPAPDPKVLEAVKATDAIIARDFAQRKGNRRANELVKEYRHGVVNEYSAAENLHVDPEHKREPALMYLATSGTGSIITVGEFTNSENLPLFPEVIRLDPEKHKTLTLPPNKIIVGEMLAHATPPFAETESTHRAMLRETFRL